MTDAPASSIPGPIDPPRRLLMGPGPVDAYPGVLRAMSAPLVGQYDPFMTSTMTETQELVSEFVSRNTWKYFTNRSVVGLIV